MTPALSVREEYNDNIFLSVANTEEDFIATISPSLEYSIETERLKRGSLLAGVNLIYYAQNSNENSADFFGRGSVSWLPAMLYTLDAGFNVTRNSRPDRTDPGSGLAYNSGSWRQNYNLTGTRAVTEKDQVALAYTYSREDYDNDDILSTSVHQVSSWYDHKLTPENSIEIGANFSAILTDQSTVDNYALTIGFTRKFHELWRFSLNGGGRYTYSTFTGSDVARSSDENWGMVSALSFFYTGEKLKGSISFKHDLYASAGSSGATERTGGTTMLDYILKDGLSLQCGVGYFLNKSGKDQYSVYEINELTTDVHSQLHYEFNRYLALEAAYHYFNVDYRATDTAANQHVFMIRLIGSHPFML